jgi:hypothetical protein
MEEVFVAMLRKGITDQGIRVIDHGVAGGLLLLLHSTLYFRLHFGLKALGSPKKDKPDVAEAIKIILGDPVDGPGKLYEARWWWRMVVWSTGAVALHNVIQQSERFKETPLALEDDPLTYLGVLVDVLQEWDRYTSARNSVFTGTLPVSSNEVRIGIGSEGRIAIAFEKEKTRTKVEKDLRCLKDWNRIIELVS